MEAEIQAALISASVTVVILAISRFVFSREDRRFPILVLIQEKLLALQEHPPWSANGGVVYFEKVRETAKELNPYFARLRWVSAPFGNCSVQKSWKKFKSMTAEQWKAENPNRAENYSDGLSASEFINEVEKILKALK